MVYLAGVISTGPDGIITGTVGQNRSVEEAKAAAKCCALTQLAVLQHHLGSLDAVKQIISLNGYVNAVAGFAESPQVINGASDLLVQVFGDAGPERWNMMYKQLVDLQVIRNPIDPATAYTLRFAGPK